MSNLSRYFNGAHVVGNFNKITKRKPKNWTETGYKIIVPFKFKWRHKIGKVECDCKVCEEHYAPYYGFDWYHSKECALIKHIEKRPQILNLNQYSEWDYQKIASTD